MEELKDTLNTAPEGQDVIPAGHTEETPNAPAVEPAQPAEAQAPQVPTEGAKAPEAPSRYLGKKYADLTQYDSAYDEAQTKIQQLGREKNLLAQQVAELSGLSYPDQSQSQAPAPVQEVEVLRKELAQTRLRIAQAEEERIIDQMVKDKPQLAPVSDHIKAAWRANPNKPLEEIITPLEKLVSVGRNENREDMLKKKTQVVETGTQSAETPVAPQVDLIAKAKESGNFDDWVAALPANMKL